MLSGFNIKDNGEETSSLPNNGKKGKSEMAFLHIRLNVLTFTKCVEYISLRYGVISLSPNFIDLVLRIIACIYF